MLKPLTIEGAPNATELGAVIDPLMLKLYGRVVQILNGL